MSSMRNLLPLLILGALLLGGCETTRRVLSVREEAQLRFQLVRENQGSLSISQRNIFLHSRFWTEERARNALARMILASQIHSRAAAGWPASAGIGGTSATDPK